MPCDRKLKPRQTIQDRAREVRAATDRLRRGLAAGTVKVVVGPAGDPAFKGWQEADRDGVSDACAFRRLQVEGSPELRRALAGQTVDRAALARGVHSHDGGSTWHDHKG